MAEAKSTISINRLDAGAKCAEPTPQTSHLVRLLPEQIAEMINSVVGRNYFGKLRVEITVKAGQVVDVEYSPSWHHR